LLRGCRRSAIRRWLLPLLLVLLPAAGWTAPPESLDKVTLQLKWKHQFQFAGYYAALEKGFYREAGLDVRIVEAEAGKEPMEAVVRGEAEFGVGTSELVLWRYRGEPVVVLGVVFQHSSLALAVRKGAGIRNPHDLAGKRVMIEPHSAELFAYLRREHIDSRRLDILPHSFDTRDLIEGRVDAMSVYTTDELFDLQRAGFDYLLFEPITGGIDFYGDNLFTNRTQIDLNPRRVKAFRAASRRGWAYAMAHPEEIARLIFEKYSQRHSLPHLLFEAEQMMPLLQPELIEPLYMHAGRWRHIADTYAELGMLPRDDPMEGFLYDADPQIDLALLRRYLSAALLGLVLIGGISLYIMRLNRRLALSEERYRIVYQKAPSAFVLWDADFRVTGWNRASEEIFGWSASEVMGRNFFDFMVPPEERDSVRRIADQVMASRDGDGLSSHWNLTRDGRRILCEWRNAPLHDGSGAVIGAVAIATDVTERKRMEERLAYMAHYDPLTELPNRSLFFDRLAQAFAVARRNVLGFSLLYLDLDDFKPINDTFGHDAGDQVLRDIARRLRDLVRESDTVARMGGDEFVVLLHGIGKVRDAEAVAEKIIAELAPPFEIAGHSIRISASIGVAIYPQHGGDAETLINAADNAMYEAKRCGRNTFRVVAGERVV
jgi:diguanylate cyclase (GGDEF)-like protein/PAS domain S-box-containing protein